MNLSLDMKLSVRCFCCGTVYNITVDHFDWQDWKNGTPANVAFPDLDENMRKLLISDVCGICFDGMFLGMN